MPLSRAPPPSADGVPCRDRIEGLLAFDGCQADEGRDASTVKSAKFGQLGNERCDHDGADAWDGLEPAIGLRQFPISLDDRAHACVDLGDAALFLGNRGDLRHLNLAMHPHIVPGDFAG